MGTNAQPQRSGNNSAGMPIGGDAGNSGALPLADAAPRITLDPAFAATPSGNLPAVRAERGAADDAVHAAALPRIEGVEFTREQIELIKRTIAVDATDDELQLFLFTCRRLRLDPFGRQIYFIKRRAGSDDEGGAEQVGRAQVSIDGFRLVAERTGEYQGQTSPEWAAVVTGDHGPVIDWYPVWPFSDPPHSARVGVYRRGFREPMYGVARFDAYKVTKRNGVLNRMWVKMGPEQLAKCAEALALRRAFPQELSGVYTPDEMGQADNPNDDDAGRSSPRAAARQSARRDAGERAAGTRDTSTAASAHAAASRTADNAEREAKRKTDGAAADAAAAVEPTAASPYPRRSPAAAPYPFPFGAQRGTPLDAKHADGERAGDYVVSHELLIRAYAWADDCLAGKPFARPGSTEKLVLTVNERPKFERLREALRAELTIRDAEHVDAEHASEPTAEQARATMQDNTAADDAREQLAEERGDALRDEGDTDDLPF